MAAQKICPIFAVISALTSNKWRQFDKDGNPKGEISAFEYHSDKCDNGKGGQCQWWNESYKKCEINAIVDELGTISLRMP